jgi:Na+/H+ antiporter NhaD/arsenite permease-like protein
LTIVVAVFVVVYIGMILGTLPGLKVNRAAIALLGAIALLATGRIDQQGAVASIDFGTIGLLFGLMIVAANFDLSGLYSLLSQRMALLTMGPRQFLAVVVALCGLAAALLTNDVIAVALAPVLLNLSLRDNSTRSPTSWRSPAASMPARSRRSSAAPRTC